MTGGLVEKVLGGEARAIARMISRAEEGFADSRPDLAEIFHHTGRAHVVGLTGVPGSGKSTLAGALTLAVRSSGRKVGIIAVDPSSPFSGGAILGDRIRMAGLAGDPGVFIRTMATRGAMGGLARASLNAVDILDAAGFDVIIVETVGVGQDEVDVVQAAHTIVVVSAPGLGDGIQAIKAGILEIADIHAVSKCDRRDSGQTVADLESMLALGRRGSGWTPPVVETSAERDQGIGELLAAIDGHRAHLVASGEMTARRRRMFEHRVLGEARHMLRQRVRKAPPELIERLMAGETDPRAAALDLLDGEGEG